MEDIREVIEAEAKIMYGTIKNFGTACRYNGSHIYEELKLVGEGKATLNTLERLLRPLNLKIRIEEV
jgi:hypothetical protein